MKLSSLKPAHGAKNKCKRVGRGIAAGQGKTCGRGTKGQKARENVPSWFEGGQTPLYKRVPKLRGVSKKAMPREPFRRNYAFVNLKQLNQFPQNTEITPQFLLEEGIIDEIGDGLRILGDGELTKPLIVKAHYFSKSAKSKIEAAGGKVEVIR
ncbi:MAG: 50S ribosomal protein L15 [Armatimonadota bacterium]|nr:50S ribosomal protein L15 [Armatimonadota bacterium]MCX7776914.1 50S ribosomal protein L15 [Armatimonadota bacterium]MDW8024746.1 50S ribosomal protein L15 [Armatimonadota bacterium]